MASDAAKKKRPKQFPDSFATIEQFQVNQLTKIAGLIFIDCQYTW